MQRIQRFMKIIGIYFIIFAALIGLYIADVTLASSIPKERIEANILDAYNQINHEGLYPSIYGLNVGFFDNWTDAISCNILINQNSDNPFYSGIANNYVIESPEEDVIEAFQHAISNEGEVTPYSNFWLGNLLFLKILLDFLKWGEIRYLLYFISVCFQILLAVLLYKKLGKRVMLSYLISSMFLCVTYNVCNIQAASDILIMQMGCVFILYFYSRLKPQVLKGRYEFFFVIGSIQFFMGYIFAPMFPLGMFLLLMMLMDHKEKIADKLKIKYFVGEAICWIIGYALTALSKQLLGYIVLGNQIGLEKMEKWSAGTIQSRLFAFLIPLKSFDNRVVKILILLAILIGILFLAAKKIKMCKLSYKSICRGIEFIFIAFLIPYLYFALLSSAVGHGFYCQNMLCLIFSLLYVIMCCFETAKKS